MNDNSHVMNNICDTSVLSQELISAEIAFSNKLTMPGVYENPELKKINEELERYTCKADEKDYALAVASGILAGMVDALYVGKLEITDKGIATSHKQINDFIQKYAASKGHDKKRLKDSIKALEDNYKVAQDNVWKGKGIGVSAKNHHLADLAHHPTPLGLVSAIAVQFFRVGTFVNKDGKWHFLLVETKKEDVIGIVVSAVITGALNWIAALAEKEYTDKTGEEIPKAIKGLVHLIASTPMIIEIIKCADNWFSHLVSDMGGSKNTAGGGMGIPGVFVSILHEMSGLPILKDSGLPAFVNDLYTNKRIDLRKEMTVYRSVGRKTIPVLLNELLVRTFYFVSRLVGEISEKGIKDTDWKAVLPFGNRTVDRMIMVSSITLSVADTADAAVHAAVESGGNWVLFAGEFAVKYNYVAAGRAGLSVFREISNEKKEAQLIHEKMLLTETQTEMVLKQLQEYKVKLSEIVSSYIADDIEAFLFGFEDINKGIDMGDSDLIIKGNVTIQRKLGREVQFTNRQEFDDLMDSDEAFVL